MEQDLNKRIDEILAMAKMEQNLAKVVGRVKVGLGAANEQKMARMIIDCLCRLPETDCETHIINVNAVLLESLVYLDTVGMDMCKLLLGYSSRVHKIPGIKNGQGELIAPWVKQHLVRVGIVINECDTRSYMANKGHGVCSGA